MEWLHPLAGFLVGVTVGLTGVGGGALMTPILVLLFGVAPVTAVGTDLWFAAVTKIAGGVVHGHNGSVDWVVFRRLCYGSLPAAILTLLLLHWLGVGKSSNSFIVPAVGGVLILTAVAMIFKTTLHAVGRQLRQTVPVEFKHVQPVLTVVAGAILGVLVTMTSIGAGALGAVMMLYLYPLRLTPLKLVGTDIVHAIPLTIVAGTGHLLMGNVNYSLLGWLVLGSIPGILVGSALSARTPERILRSGIAVVLVAVGVKMLAQ